MISNKQTALKSERMEEKSLHENLLYSGGSKWKETRFATTEILT